MLVKEEQNRNNPSATMALTGVFPAEIRVEIKTQPKRYGGPNKQRFSGLTVEDESPLPSRKSDGRARRTEGEENYSGTAPSGASAVANGRSKIPRKEAVECQAEFWSLSMSPGRDAIGSSNCMSVAPPSEQRGKAHEWREEIMGVVKTDREERGTIAVNVVITPATVRRSRSAQQVVKYLYVAICMGR